MNSTPAAAPAAPENPKPVARRYWLRRATVVVLGLVLLTGLATTVELWRIRSDLEAGRAALDELDLETVRQQGIEASLAGAADHLASANSRADGSPLLGAVAAIPLLGSQVDAIRDLTDAADELGGLARQAGSTIAAALDQASADPAARVTLLDVVSGELDRVEQAVAGLDLGADGFLLPPLSGNRASIEASLATVGPRFGELRTQIDAFRALLSGPTQYLVTVGNNAEMRSGQGMPLSAGVATISDGDIALGEFKSTVSEMITDNPTGEFNANIPHAIASTYPRWSLCCSFPEIAVTPTFPIAANLYADLAYDTQGWEVEGVLHVDALALAGLLEVVGPVTVDGVEYTSETAPQLVLNEPYLRYDSPADRDVRINEQSNLAQALFQAITSRDIDVLDVVASLQDSARGRHLMVWSRDPVVQELMVDLGFSGIIGARQTLVSLLNTSANKLDWYIDPVVEVHSEQLDSGEWLVTVDVLITNPDGITTSAYADGFLPELPNGKHRALLMFMVPSYATDLGISDPDPTRVVRMTEAGRDGFSFVFGTRFTVDRGDSRIIQATWRQPEEIASVVVAPSARARPVTWIVDGVAYDDATAFAAPFRSGDSRTAAERALVVLSAVALFAVWMLLIASELERRGLLRRVLRR